MTAVAQVSKSLYSYPPGSFERRLYQRVIEISSNPAYSWGFRTLAMQVQAGWMSVQPTDLSTEAIRAALLTAAKKERKAHLKRWRAGERDGAPFPEIWDAFIRTDKNGCRYAKWCNGRCDPSAMGDRQHWSVAHYVHDQHFADAIGLQIFQGEVPDGSAGPACLVLSYYVGGIPCDESYDLHLSPVDARKVGEMLRDASDVQSGSESTPGVLVDLEFASGDRLVLERHRPRSRKDGYADREVFELLLYPAEETVPLRMRSDYHAPWWLAKHLMSAADDAEGVVAPMPKGWREMVEEAGR